MSCFRFVSEHHEAYPVKRLCELVGVSRSGFYAWSRRPPSDRALADAALTAEISEIHKRSLGTYGAPRVHGQLRRRGHRVGRKRVARLMADAGLCGAHSRRKWRRGTSKRTAPAPDLIERDFTAEEPDERWVGDITEFACIDGKLYLAGLLDLCDRSIVGWSMSTRATMDLTVNAVVMALSQRQPDGAPVHHADRGSQYTGGDFVDTATDLGVALSYGRTGICWDNAAMESTWATVKRDLGHIHGDLTRLTRAELRTIVFAYIETFYNRQRHQARLGHRTPAEAYTAAIAA